MPEPHDTQTNGQCAPDIWQEWQAQGSTVIENLARWRATQGDAPCLFYGEENLSYTYSEFDRLCNQVANGYAKLGVKKGDRISVLSKNAFVTTLTMFAAWKLGAVYCPICNHYKGDLLAYVLNDTAPGVLLLDAQFVQSLNDIQSHLNALPKLVVHQPKPNSHDYDATLKDEPRPDFETTPWDTLLDTPDTDPDVSVSEDDLANIVYTSGTTGNPKGVVQNHKWMHAYCYLSLRHAFANPEKKATVYSDLPLYHVGGAVYNVVSAIWGGNRLVLWDRFSPNDFWRRIKATGATHAILMDVMIDWLMKNPPAPDDADNSLSAVVMNPLPGNHYEVAKRFGIDFIQTGYGSTELGVGFFGLVDVFPEKAAGDTIRQTHRQIAAQSLITGGAAVKKGFMGLPSPLMDVTVLDEAGNPVGPGVGGQAAFRPKIPAIIFCEYFNKPEVTREAVKDGWYLSPDIVHYDENGLYYFEDRKQGFIRVRGENLSATTVEHQLNKHPEIQRSAVVGIPAAEGNEQEIVYFIIKKPGAGLNAEQLQDWVAQQLPKFMRPAHIRFVDEFPVTRTFKIEKYKLKQSIMEELAR